MMSREPWFTVSIILLSLLLGGIVLMKVIFWAKDPREGLLRDYWRKIRDRDLWVIFSLNIYCWTLMSFFIREHIRPIFTAYAIIIAGIIILSILVKRNLRSPLNMVVGFHTVFLWGFFPATILGSWDIFDGLMTSKKTRRTTHAPHPTLPIRRIPSR